MLPLRQVPVVLDAFHDVPDQEHEHQNSAGQAIEQVRPHKNDLLVFTRSQASVSAMREWHAGPGRLSLAGTCFPTQSSTCSNPVDVELKVSDSQDSLR